MVVLSSSLIAIPTLRFFRGSNGSRMLSEKKSDYSRKFDEKKIRVFCCNGSVSSKPSLWRRDLVLFTLSSSLFPFSGCLAEEDVRAASFVDEINAYTYSYPVEMPSEKFLFKWVESRKPERYSSAAPLSPDARLRIVSERVDIVDNLIISVTIGPPNSQFLKSKDKKTWAAKDVADSVLSDKSALRVTSSQRMSESSVLDAHASEIDGEQYWYYEYLVRKSPTRTAQESNLYRHYVSSTAEREGIVIELLTASLNLGIYWDIIWFGGVVYPPDVCYLYSLSASTLDKQWTKMGPLLEKTVASFRLLPPTDNYVPPYKDPWRFW